VNPQPGAVALLAFALAAQITLSVALGPPRASALDLPPAPAPHWLHLASFGEPIAAAQLATLYLQAFDNQPGVSIPFQALDYDRVESWLDLISALDPRSAYPLLLAAQVYAQVPDPERTRRMFDWVERRFEADPDRHWRWLAHAAIIARHRLRDTGLALRYARAISERATAPSVPPWARQMSVLLAADLGETEAARVLLGGLVDSGAIQDPGELEFLLRRIGPAPH
jgi:hypothetical protein